MADGELDKLHVSPKAGSSSWIHTTCGERLTSATKHDDEAKVELGEDGIEDFLLPVCVSITPAGASLGVFACQATRPPQIPTNVRSHENKDSSQTPPTTSVWNAAPPAYPTAALPPVCSKSCHSHACSAIMVKIY